MSHASDRVYQLLAEFLEAINWFCKRYADAARLAKIEAYGADTADAYLNAAWKAAWADKPVPKPNIGKHYNDNGSRSQYLPILRAGDELSRIADSWGFDNKPLIAFLKGSHPMLHEIPDELDILLEQIGIRAETLSSKPSTKQLAATVSELHQAEAKSIPLTSRDDQICAAILKTFAGTPRRLFLQEIVNKSGYGKLPVRNRLLILVEQNKIIHHGDRGGYSLANPNSAPLARP